MHLFRWISPFLRLDKFDQFFLVGSSQEQSQLPRQIVEVSDEAMVIGTLRRALLQFGFEFEDGGKRLLIEA
jgi:hypothetical protein